MNEYLTRDILVNWKYQRGMYKDEEMNWGKYQKLSQTLEELEELIVQRLPAGGLLSEYAKVSGELGHLFGAKIYAEVMRLYELCGEHDYFDVSEIDDVLSLNNNDDFKGRIVPAVTYLIARCPVHVTEKKLLYNAQWCLFSFGDENEVWFAYRKGLFPKEMLEKLFVEIKKYNCPRNRYTWIIAWMSI